MTAAPSCETCRHYAQSPIVSAFWICHHPSRRYVLAATERQFDGRCNTAARHHQPKIEEGTRS